MLVWVGPSGISPQCPIVDQQLLNHYTPSEVTTQSTINRHYGSMLSKTNIQLTRIDCKSDRSPLCLNSLFWKQNHEFQTSYEELLIHGTSWLYSYILSSPPPPTTSLLDPFGSHKTTRALPNNCVCSILSPVVRRHSRRKKRLGSSYVTTYFTSARAFFSTT